MSTILLRRLLGCNVVRRCQRSVNTTSLIGQQMGLKTSTPTQAEITKTGVFGTLDFAVHFTENEQKISGWHDIPAWADEQKGTVNFLTEIPRYTTAKMEIATGVALNPIIQDVKKGLPRHYHGPLYWNYGCVPQTWEDPTHQDPEVEGVFGDNDPLDVVEIGSSTLELGTITVVKPLGIFSMIDGGELDWKMIAINVDDPLAGEINDVDDIDKHFPGTISGIREWFRWYKTPDGKPINAFGHNEEALSREHALTVVASTHAAWKDLMQSSSPPSDIWTGN